MKTGMLRILIPLVVMLISVGMDARAQSFPVPSTPVPFGTQVCIPFTVSGLNGNITQPVVLPANSTTGFIISGFTVNIVTSHPWTLQLTLISPAGTVLMLSSFNGWGGSNYTNTVFTQSTGNSILGIPGPMTGNYLPQGNPPGFNAFLGENPNGVWQFCILDTLTDSTSVPGAGGGLGANSSASGSMGFGSSCSPPCTGAFQNTISIGMCPGDAIGLAYYILCDPSDFLITLNPGSGWVFAPGTYYAQCNALCGNACILSYTINVFQNPSLNIGPDMVHTICDGESVNIYQGLSLPNGSTVNGNWWSGQPEMVSVAGIYSVIAEDNGFCADTALVEVIVLPKINLGPDILVDGCFNTPVDLTQYANNPGAVSQWFENGSPISAPVSVTTPGNYTLIASDPFWCNDTLDIIFNPTMGPSLGPDVFSDFCDNTMVNLDTVFNIAGLNCAWTNNGSAVPDPTAINQSGTYVLIATDINGCQDTAEVTLTAFAAPSLGPDQWVDFCDNVSVDLNSLVNSSGSVAIWYENGNPLANPTNVSQPGTFTVIATTSIGCTDTAEVTLNQLQAPDAGPDQLVFICQGEQTDLTALFTLSGLTDDWYLNGALISQAIAATATIGGTYMVVATDMFGCADTAVATLTVNPKPQLGPDQQLDFCDYETVDLTPLYNTTGLMPSWSLGGSAVSNPTTVNTPGIYTLIAMNNSGCSDTAEVVLNMNIAPVLGPDQPVDFCSNTTVNLNSLYNITGLTSQWTYNGIVVVIPTSVNTTGDYTLAVMDANGCVDTAVATLSSLPLPSLGPDQTADLCSGQTFDLTTLFNTIGLTTSWTLSGNPVPDPTSVNQTGTYQLVAIATNGCEDTADVTLNVQAVPVLGPNLQITSCQNEPVDLTSLYNTGINTVAWTENNVPVPDPTYVNQPGLYMIIATNSFGCTDTAEVTLTINPVPVLGSDQNIGFCSNTPYDLTTLYPITGVTVQWTLGGMPVADPQSVSQGGTYQLVAANNLGCSDTALVQAMVYVAPELGSDLAFTLCPWQTVNFNTLFSATGLNEVWSLNGVSIGSPGITHDPGIYHLTVTDSNSCMDEVSVTIDTVFCLCDADFAYSGKCLQEPVLFSLLADSVIMSAFWSFSNPAMPSQSANNPSVKFLSDDIVEVTLQVTLSCGVINIVKQIKMEDCAKSCPVYFPNAFTPNNDGINERFKAENDCIPLEFEMQVHNRFGQMIFQSEELSHSWDGKYLGKPAPEGLYVYRATYRFPYQSRQTVKGIISLIR